MCIVKTLRFDFENEPVYFENPVKIISTHELTEVAACFSQIQEALAEGYYVAGYLSYEAAPAFDPKMLTHPKGRIPLLWFGVFKNKSPLPELDESSQYQPQLYQWHSDTSKEAYEDAIKQVHHAIKHGDTYQINYTLRIGTSFKAETLGFYQHLKQAQQSSFCAYLDLDDFQILSASPELFFKRNGDKLTARPMKGTMPRGMTPALDIKNKEILTQSEKDQAENLMIVDLLRNDLSILAKTGSVKVPSLFEIEQYPSVWQMTSTVEATLKDEVDYFTIFKALFPCGSITGAPKISAMNLIANLEASPRNVYCGAIGYFTPDQNAIFNVPIRTVLVEPEVQTATYGVGGGITWYSTAKAEYQEALDKAQIILSQIRTPKRLLESFLLDNGKIFLKEEHLARLKNSCDYFLFAFPEQKIIQALDKLANDYPKGQFKGRLLLDKMGVFELNCDEVSLINQPIKARWAKEAINRNNALFYHKTTERHIYPPVQPGEENILFNDKNEVTEFVNGNIAVLIKDQWYTPPIECGLLAGTMRAHLLSQNKLIEKVLTKQDLENAQEIAFINSVRGWLKVELN